jgi:hypothetical protein
MGFPMTEEAQEDFQVLLLKYIGRRPRRRKAASQDSLPQPAAGHFTKAGPAVRGVLMQPYPLFRFGNSDLPLDEQTKPVPGVRGDTLVGIGDHRLPFLLRFAAFSSVLSQALAESRVSGLETRNSEVG